MRTLKVSFGLAHQIFFVCQMSFLNLLIFKLSSCAIREKYNANIHVIVGVEVSFVLAHLFTLKISFV